MNPASDAPTRSPEILAKKQDNASTRFCALPSELIARILLDVRDARLEPSSPFASPSEWLSVDWMAWLPVTHVCHRIRTVALASPLLWDHVYVRSLAATAAFLERSGQAPIDVWVDRRAALPLVEVVLGQLPRFRSLLLDKSKLYTSPDSILWSGKPAPSLVSLAICQGDGYGSQWTSVPDLVFRSDMPSLQSLNVESLGWRWMDAILPDALTRLSVSTGFTWMHTKAAAEKTLSVLRGLPRLESLSILDPLPRNEGELNLPEEEQNNNEPVDTVSLPKLQSLTCSGAVFSCLRFLDRLSILLTCKICVWISFLDDDSVHIPTFVTLLDKNVCTADAHAPPLVELSLSVGNVKDRTLYARAFRTERTPPPAGTPPPDADFVLECHTTSDEERFIRSDVLYEIVGAINLSSVRTLELHNIAAFGPLVYDYVFRHMDGIGTICFCQGCTPCTFLLVLDDDNDEDEVQIFLPQLRCLVFSHVDFSLNHCSSGEQVSSHTSPTSLRIMASHWDCDSSSAECMYMGFVSRQLFLIDQGDLRFAVLSVTSVVKSFEYRNEPNICFRCYGRVKIERLDA